MAESDVFWDKVVTVDVDGVDQVYDLAAPELHNFVAGDMLVRQHGILARGHGERRGDRGAR